MSDTARSTSDKYLIEFAGLPGVGKSFLHHKLFIGLQSSNAKVYFPRVYLVERRFQKILLKLSVVFIFILQNISASILLIRAFNARFHFKLLFNWFFVLASVQRMQKISYGLLDQGIIQAIWSCLYRGIDYKTELLSEAITQVLHKADIRKIIVVQVLADTEQNSNWLAVRKDGRSPLEDASPLRLGDLSESISAALSSFKELHLEEVCDVEIINYQNVPGDSSRKFVDDFLSRLGKA